MRAAIYLRISKDRTGAEAGVQRQEHECRALVDAKGWELVAVEQDNDITAFDGRHRPGYERLLGHVDARAVDIIVAWHPDRLVRNPRELEDLIDALDGAGVQVETCRAGRYDLSTRSGRTTARLVGAVARDESEAKAERLRAMHADRARRGLFSGGPRPYGYRPQPDGSMVVVDAEAAIIREVADRVLLGEWVGQIAADLNARGVPTARGAKWRAQTLRRLVTSDAVAGRREHNGAIHPATWPAILDSATVRQARARINDPSRARGTVARVALLAGIARCGVCDTKMISQRRQWGTRVYVCPATTRGGCGGVQVVAEPLEDHVLDLLLGELDKPEFLEHLADDTAARQRDEIDAELDRLARRREAHEREWALADDIDAAMWARSGRAIEGEQARLEDELAALPTPIEHPDPAVVRQAWPAMTLAEKRGFVGPFIEAVRVQRATRRGPGFDKGRVDPKRDIEWGTA